MSSFIESSINKLIEYIHPKILSKDDQEKKYLYWDLQRVLDGIPLSNLNIPPSPIDSSY